MGSAERRCGALEQALIATPRQLLPTLKNVELPPLMHPTQNGSFTHVIGEHLDVHRSLHAQQRRHAAELRDLTSCVSQQLRERDCKMTDELSVMLGEGLPRLLE